VPVPLVAGVHGFTLTPFVLVVGLAVVAEPLRAFGVADPGPLPVVPTDGLPALLPFCAVAEPPLPVLWSLDVVGPLDGVALPWTPAALPFDVVPAPDVLPPALAPLPCPAVLPPALAPLPCPAVLPREVAPLPWPAGLPGVFRAVVPAGFVAEPAGRPIPAPVVAPGAVGSHGASGVERCSVCVAPVPAVLGRV